MSDYHINIFYSEDDGAYIADIPDLETCSACGRTPEEALAEVMRAKTAWLDAARNEGRPIPAPSYRPVIYQVSHRVVQSGGAAKGPMCVADDHVMAQIREALAALERRVVVSAAFLYGSHVRGRADADSDIDLAIFVEGAQTWGLMERADLAVQVQTETGDEIELHFFPASALEHCESASFAAYVQKHGVRIDDAAVGRVTEKEARYAKHDAVDKKPR